MLAVLLCAVWGTNFLLFHTLAEMFSIVVAFAAAAVAWYSRDWIGRNYLLLLGVSQLFVGSIDILHTLSYKGVGVLDARGGNLPTQLWLAGRVFEAACFLIAVWAPQRRYTDRQLVSALSLAWLVAVGVILTGWAPAAFIPGEGVTPLKMVTELVLVCAFSGIILQLRRHAGDYDPRICTLLLISAVAKLITELSFAWYTDVFGLTHLVGHTFKIISAWAFLKAVVESGLSRPQSLIFGALARERALSSEVTRHAQTLDAVLDATLAPVLMMNGKGEILFASRAAEQFLERGSRELVGRTWREAGLSEALMVPLEGMSRWVLTSGEPCTQEQSLTWRGERLCLELQVSPVRDGGGLVSSVVAFLRDVTARKAMEEDLTTSLEDNRLLIQEVHHRVKNNLQIVSSILQMQGWRVTDPELRRHLEEACGRILSLAKVHELIYKQDTLASVDFNLFARTLCGELFRMHNLRDDGIELSVQGDAIILGVDKAEPLALIVHELVVDTLKNAFGSNPGRLHVEVGQSAAAEGVLTLREEGGRPDRVLDFEGSSGDLGLRMVGALVKQMHGTINVASSGSGLAVEVRFPLAEIPVPA